MEFLWETTIYPETVDPGNLGTMRLPGQPASSTCRTFMAGKLNVVESFRADRYGFFDRSDLLQSA